MTPGPDPRASLRGFLALVMDMVRVDPDRRPSAELQRWYREIALAADFTPEHAATNRSLLVRALRLQQEAFGGEVELPSGLLDELALQGLDLEKI